MLDRKRLLPAGLCALLLGLAACGGSTPAAPRPAVDEKVAMGKLLFFDASLSEPAGQSCASCHAPERAFTDPRGGITSGGAVVGLFGARNAPTAAYAAFTPGFHYDPVEGLYSGGQFLDGRASSLEEQAQGPPLNPVEMHNPDRSAYVAKVAAAPYAARFRQLYGETVFNDPEKAYLAIADAISAFERSPEVSPFTSKYDAYLRGAAALTAQAARGLALFEGRGGCAACHPHQPGADRRPPLFTDFTYDNLGVPRNQDNPFYGLSAAFNPQGAAFVDEGLAANPQVVLDGRASQSRGKFKVPTLRNIAVTGPYMHNGAFRTLKDVMAFYNRRDVDLARWGSPEVAANVNRTELGNLGLSEAEEDDLVAFLNTLTDGYRR